MTNVYIVTEGSYSDYRICAVYDTEAAAEYYAEHWGGDVEEWDLNPGADMIAAHLLAFEVIMHRNGDVVGVKLVTPEYGQRGWTLMYSPTLMGFTLAQNRAQPVKMVTEVVARDEEHAIKIANERRARFIAMDKWPDDSARRENGTVYVQLGKDGEGAREDG